YVSAENDQQIVQLTEEGTATEHEIQVPECFSTDSIWPNYGFESLTYEPAGGVFWTTTEQGLRSDTKAPVTADNPSPALLRLQAFTADGEPLRQLLYQTDAPTARPKARAFAFGVPELLAIDDSTLLVMERELYIPRRYSGAKCNICLYRVNTKTDEEGILPKHLIHSFSTGIRLFGRKNFANYEGMCLGPRLDDGRQTVLLIADSQNRAGNALYRLKDYIRVITIKP
ncbi:MAG: esterase-like activity of phytase family protein, partial [Bacteroidaceae bacterium]|nr:esterase-like activity of phytase family protein [Bacteroidaceae bacterium]